MCGIVGFTGENQAAPILLDGLSKLGKYRAMIQPELQFVMEKKRQKSLKQKAD